MPDDISHPDSRLVNPTVRHERSDASFPWILYLLIFALALAALVFYGIWVFFDRYTNYQAEVKKSTYPLAPKPSTALPPEPRLEPLDRLQDIESSNVYERQAGKESTLNTLGRTREKGFVHIPIDRAMRQLENKLPARKEPPEAQQRRERGLQSAGEPNSGRVFRRRSR